MWEEAKQSNTIKMKYCCLIAAETVSGVDEIDDFLLFLSNS